MIITAFLLFSCTKEKKTYTVENVNGVEIYKNSSEPAEPNLKVEPKLLLDLKFSEVEHEGNNLGISVRNVTLDRFGNVYNLDRQQQKIFKFDSKGKYLKTIGQKGTGPGEFQFETKHFEIIKDTLIVSIPFVWKHIRFDLDGNFISDKFYPDTNEFPDMFWRAGRFFCAMSYIPRADVGRAAYFIKLNLFNDQLKYVNTFDQIEVNYALRKLDLNNPEYLVFASSADSLIYVPKKSYNEYQIDVFNFQGDKIQTIKMSHRAIKYSNEELAQIRKDVGPDYQIIGKFKNSIEDIKIDKYNRIWVKRAKTTEESLNDTIKIYDLFKDGIYLNSVTLPLAIWADIDFDQGKMIVTDFNNNSTRIYDY